ncbi:MAG: DoxX family protein [Planctomycetota bacterium]|jgi:putative oxidoreductase
MNDILRLLGRFALAAIFLGSAVGKITNYSDTLAKMEDAGIPMVQAALPGALAFLFVGGVSVVTGFMSSLGALLLLIFLALATFYFHLDFGDPVQQIQFMKNLAIAGGLLTLMGSGPGGFAIGASGDSAK